MNGFQKHCSCSLSVYPIWFSVFWSFSNKFPQFRILLTFTYPVITWPCRSWQNLDSLHRQVCGSERYSETFKFERVGAKLNTLLATLLVYSYDTIGREFCQWLMLIVEHLRMLRSSKGYHSYNLRISWWMWDIWLIKLIILYGNHFLFNISLCTHGAPPPPPPHLSCHIHHLSFHCIPIVLNFIPLESLTSANVQHYGLCNTPEYSRYTGAM